MTTSGMNRRTLLAAVPLVGIALYGGGLIGVGAAQAATNKPVVGVGIRACKRPGGSSARVRTVASDGAGRFAIPVSETGTQSIDIDKPQLQLAVNAEAAADRARAGERLVIVRFSPRLRVTGPNGQAAVPGHPGVFILTAETQTFMTQSLNAGAIIAGTVETVDIADLFPGQTRQSIVSYLMANPVLAVIAARMVANPDGAMPVTVRSNQ